MSRRSSWFTTTRKLPLVRLRRPRARRSLCIDPLEARIVLDGTGFAGNACPPNLNLSGVPAQTATVGQEFVLNLLTAGATAVDLNATGQPTGNTLTWSVDPDVPTDTPTGVTISSAGVLRWTPTASQIGSHQIVILVVDTGTPALADAEILTINVANQAPIIDLNGAAAGSGFASTYTEDDAPVVIVSNTLTVSDPDGSNLTGATARITNLLDGNAELLSVDVTGTSLMAVYNPTTGTLTISGSAAASVYQGVLRTLSYRNSSQDPDTTTRSVEVTVSDGTDTSNVAIASVTVVAVNDAPNLSPISNVLGTVGQLIEVVVTATDVDSQELTFVLDRDDPGNNTPASATIERINATSARIRWMANASGTFQFNVLVVDGGTPARVDRESFTVTIGDTAPIVDLNGADAGLDFAVNYEEGDGFATIVGAGLTVTDGDSSQLMSATVVLLNRPNGTSESLRVDTAGTSVTATYDAVTGMLSLSGSDTVANYQQVLRTLQYQNLSEDPSIAERNVSVVVNDGTRTSATAMVRISVTAVDDAPVLTLPAPFDVPANSVAGTVGVEISFTATATDVDTPADERLFSLDLTASGISPGANQPTITTAPSQVPGGLFRWTPSEAGTFTITVVVRDSSGLEDTQTFTVVVAAPRIAPLSSVEGSSDREEVAEPEVPVPLPARAMEASHEEGESTFAAMDQVFAEIFTGEASA